MYQEEINLKWQKIHELRSFLNRKDYTDHRQHDEPDKMMAEELKAARIDARAQINILEKEIAELEILEKEHQETNKEIHYENY
jgi:hypothetical protein